MEEKGTIQLSRKELKRLRLMDQVEAGTITLIEAAEETAVSTPRLRLQSAKDRCGDPGGAHLIHARRR